MRRPAFFSILGFLAIAIASAFYGIFLLQTTPGPITITITAIVIVCIILGMAQIILGYEIRNLQSVSFQRPISESQPERIPRLVSSQEPPPYRPTITEAKIPRPHSFPLTAHKHPITVKSMQRDESSPLEDLAPAHIPRKVIESEKRLENLRQALRRAEHSEKPPSEPARKPSLVKIRHVSIAPTYSPTEGYDPKKFQVTLVGRDEIVFTAILTGKEVRFPCYDSEILEKAWRAFAEGVKVRPVIQNGRIIHLELE